MKRIFITGSTDGLGYMAAERLIKKGHQVILHARNEQKAQAVWKKLPMAEAAVVGDLSSISETTDIAQKINDLGSVDSVIHNAGVGFMEPYLKTIDGLPHVFAINSLAPYILTCLIKRPERLIYTSSGMHESAEVSLSDPFWESRKWNAAQAYSDTKFHNILLAFAISRHWPGIISNVVSPGWVATKMGGQNAPGDLDKAPETQVWLAVSDEKSALESGRFLFHQKRKAYLSQADDISLQDQFMDLCKSLTGINYK
jgi:NAD(P)-dependent dehydrogenase (short-subunit alcohol dehydrogenase family)